MFSDYQKALAQLFSDARLRRVLLRSILITFLGVVVLSIGAAFLIPWLVQLGAAALGYDVSQIGWLDWAVGGVSGVGTLFLSFLIFPGLSTAVAGLFLDEISEAVESRYYPDLPAPRTIGMGETVANALRFALVSIGLNIVCIPLYFIPVVGFFIYWALNGYLLSREFFEQAAFRRARRATVEFERRRNRGPLWLEGVGLAVLATIPLANLTLPVVGTASLTHFVQRKKIFANEPM